LEIDSGRLMISQAEETLHACEIFLRNTQPSAGYNDASGGIPDHTLIYDLGQELIPHR
jgi:hypothetical protein